MVFTMYQHELATGIHLSPQSEPLSHVAPNPVSLGYPRALALGALLHA